MLLDPPAYNLSPAVKRPKGSININGQFRQYVYQFKSERTGSSVVNRPAAGS